MSANPSKVVRIPSLREIRSGRGMNAYVSAQLHETLLFRAGLKDNKEIKLDILKQTRLILDQAKHLQATTTECNSVSGLQTFANLYRNILDLEARCAPALGIPESGT